MIAIAMYISLGVVVTLLLALLVMPLIWRRAIRLTEKRITAEMPISYGELQAEKDMLRAEQAIEFRRMEVLADARYEEVANQSLKIDNLYKKVEDRDQTISDHLAHIDTLSNLLGDQKKKTADTEDRLKSTADDLATARADIANLEEAKASLEGNFADTKASLEHDIDERETHLNEQKIELAAQMARIESHKQEISELTGKLTTETNLLAETKGLLAQKTSDFDHIKERQDKQQSKIDELQSELADKDSEIDTLNRRLERAQEQNKEKADDSNERLVEAEARRAEAEAKIASLSGQLADQTKSDIGDEAPNVDDALQEKDTVIAGLKKDKTELESALKAAHQIIDRLDRKVKKKPKKDQDKISEAPLTSGEIALRNEMKTIAGLITQVAAKQEGETSPIPSLLETSNMDAPKKESNGSEANGTGNGEAKKQTAEASDQDDATKNPWEEVFSLTDRLKQMRKPRETKKSAP